jgi:hypothetical protein
VSRETCTVQLTIRPGDTPMLNLYAENIPHLVELLAQITESGLAREIAALAGEPPNVRVTPSGRPIASFEPEPEHDPAAPFGTCPKHGLAIQRRIARTRDGREFESFECRERDDDEARGWCRFRFDPKTRTVRRVPNPGEAQQQHRNDRPLAARLA